MIQFEHTEVMGWEHAIRGMRNPMNSWAQSDSRDGCGCGFCAEEDGCPEWYDCHGSEARMIIGPKDLDLMTRLRNAGTDHRKFMRMLVVYVDITAPLYWWKEFDTYKVGTVANSCSTMHKIHAKEFTWEDFSMEHLIAFAPVPGMVVSPAQMLDGIVKALNSCRTMYLATQNKEWWWQMIQLLPTSYNQKRTVMLNYEVLANIYKSRKNHKLDEWRDLCFWIESLPYSELITGGTDQKGKGEQNERTEDNSGIGEASSGNQSADQKQ